MHFNVPRDWFETNSRHQKRYSESGKKIRECRGLLLRVITEIQFQHPLVLARINQSFYSSGLHAKTNRAAWTGCGWPVLWQIMPIFTRQVVPFLKAGCCWITDVNILFTIKLVGGAVTSWLARDSGASGLGSSPGRGHCVVFLGKTLYSHSASLHPGV